MKKSVCLMAILGAFAGTVLAANQQFKQTINVKFAGEVVNTGCTVGVVNGTDGTVRLANLNLKKATAEGNHGDLVPVVFKITDCDAKDQITSVALVSDVLMGNAALSNVKGGTLSTDKAHVVVQMYSDNTGNNEGLAKAQGNELNAGKGYVKVGYAALKRVGGAPDAGKVNAEGMFEVTYN